ncbi:Ion channel [mine drainage metagenome]|uniref:Ion channel n=1 Tax=mine drainage metagenome TaxID=410659 RepID=A0A1J5R984_9ZZZZ
MRSILEIVLGLSLTACTLVIHSFGMYLVMHRFELHWPVYLKEKNEFKRQFYFGHLIMIMLLTHLLEVLLLATVLFGIHVFSDFRVAFYFSGETYTTVGFGDILLPAGWRQLALFMAMSGMFSFGWSTGVLVNIVGKTYEAQFANLRKHGRNETD